MRTIELCISALCLAAGGGWAAWLTVGDATTMASEIAKPL